MAKWNTEKGGKRVLCNGQIKWGKRRVRCLVRKACASMDKVLILLINSLVISIEGALGNSQT